MGAQESRLDDSQGAELKGIKGFHVLRVADSSPAAEAGIEPFFDYVVGVGGHGVTDDGDELTGQLERAEGKVITLQVYSARRQEVRDLRVMPNRKWSTSGSSRAAGQQPSLLGLSLRLCSPEHALNNVWHILDIVEGSPAQDAGLVPFGDWVIGYAGGVLRGEHDLYRVIESYEDKPLRLFVYNADYEVTREVVIVPNKSWGAGDGLLGCSIGFGFLHRIPKTSRRPLDLPPEGAATENRQPAATNGASFNNDGSPTASEGVQIVPTSNADSGVLRSMITPPPPGTTRHTAANASGSASDQNVGKGRPPPLPTSTGPSAAALSKPIPASPQRTVSPNSMRGPPVSPSGRSFPGRSSVAEVIREEDE